MTIVPHGDAQRRKAEDRQGLDAQMVSKLQALLRRVGEQLAQRAEELRFMDAEQRRLFEEMLLEDEAMQARRDALQNTKAAAEAAGGQDNQPPKRPARRQPLTQHVRSVVNVFSIFPTLDIDRGPLSRLRASG